MKHLQRSKVYCLSLGVPAANAETRVGIRRVRRKNHLAKSGFMKDYTKWTHHSETRRMKGKAVRQRIRKFEGDARVADMIVDEA
jgi:hypothetical protein